MCVGLSSEFHGLRLEDVVFEIPDRKAQREGTATVPASKRLIDHVSGTVTPGQLVAVLGRSGAGKTTLLNLCAHRLVPSSGRVLYNGTPLHNLKALQHRITYVMQADVFNPTSTCVEMLQFAAALQLRGMTATQRSLRVKRTLSELGLLECADTRVSGLTGKGGLSGGEAKRLSIAIGLLQDPPLLLLDEPTSGLDSHSALNVMRHLQTLVAAGRTVVATIHQPSSQVFANFDQLVVIEAGKAVYWGPAKDLVPFMGTLGHEVPPHTNPADWILQLLATEAAEHDPSLEGAPLVEHMVAAYRPADAQTPSPGAGAEVNEAPLGYATSAIRQFGLLAQRNVRNFVRSPQASTIRLLQALFTALLCGLIYLRLDYSPAGVRSRLGAFFFLLTNQTFGPLYSVLNTFQTAKALLLREKQNGMYRLSAYVAAKVFVEMPETALFPLLIGPIVVYMCNLTATAEAVGVLMLTLFLQAAVAQGLGLAVSAIAPSVTAALALAPVFILPPLLFGGLFTDANAIPAYFQWLNTVSFFRLAYDTLLINEFRHAVFPPCPAGHGGCYPDPDALFRSLSIDPSMVWRNLGVLAGYAVGLRLLAYVFLIIATRERKSY